MRITKEGVVIRNWRQIRNCKSIYVNTSASSVLHELVPRRQSLSSSLYFPPFVEGEDLPLDPIWNQLSPARIPFLPHSYQAHSSIYA